MRDKIINRFNIQVIGLSIFLTVAFPGLHAQKNQPQVIKTYNAYIQTVKKDSSKKMVELKTIMPNIRYDLRYATINNFMHQQFYKNTDLAFLRLPVVYALAKVQQELNEKGLSLKIWDAYRPYHVTVKMWELIKDDRYVADPKKGSGHNRGIAVDLTIIDKATGSELNMGTGFDSFSDTAHQDFMNLPTEILRNRSLLKTTMEKYGFKALNTEWWHFYWSNSEYELLDINAKKLKKIN
ncbi:MAG TPA: M15 family metallopeptidase [Chitinophagaceae bacterium]|jgi:D-alanyl-D-alanine dipeptidase|nr:M15 family metallopeptidase [Chitinophagaceae bacterium]